MLLESFNKTQRIVFILDIVNAILLVFELMFIIGLFFIRDFFILFYWYFIVFFVHNFLFRLLKFFKENYDHFYNFITVKTGSSSVEKKDNSLLFDSPLSFEIPPESTYHLQTNVQISDPNLIVKLDRRFDNLFLLERPCESGEELKLIIYNFSKEPVIINQGEPLYEVTFYNFKNPSIWIPESGL